MFDVRRIRVALAFVDVKHPPSGRPALLHHLAKDVLDARFVRREIISSAWPTQFELTTDYSPDYQYSRGPIKIPSTKCLVLVAAFRGSFISSSASARAAGISSPCLTTRFTMPSSYSSRAL